VTESLCAVRKDLADWWARLPVRFFESAAG
jgi:hypothetical protein